MESHEGFALENQTALQVIFIFARKAGVCLTEDREGIWQSGEENETLDPRGSRRHSTSELSYNRVSQQGLLSFSFGGGRPDYGQLAHVRLHA